MFYLIALVPFYRLSIWMCQQPLHQWNLDTADTTSQTLILILILIVNPYPNLTHYSRPCPFSPCYLLRLLHASRYRFLSLSLRNGCIFLFISLGGHKDS